MKILANGIWAAAKNNDVIQVFIGNSISVSNDFGAALPMGFLDGAAKEGVTIKSNALTFSAHGRRQFRSADGMNDLTVVACEPGCLDRIPGGTGQGGAERDKLAILRSVCQHAAFQFDGLADQLISQSFANHGA